MIDRSVLACQVQVFVIWSSEEANVTIMYTLTQVPNLSWRDVLLELDYPDLYFPSPEALNLVCSAYKAACNRVSLGTESLLSRINIQWPSH